MGFFHGLLHKVSELQDYTVKRLEDSNPYKIHHHHYVHYFASDGPWV